MFNVLFKKFFSLQNQTSETAAQINAQRSFLCANVALCALKE
jgi:hypothetical protein